MISKGKEDKFMCSIHLTELEASGDFFFFFFKETNLKAFE